MTLPNFLLVGAAKAGTTSLYHYLGQHPDIFMSPVKETFFFSQLSLRDFPGRGQHYARVAVTDPSAYAALFAGACGERAVGEACTAYLYYHQTAVPHVLRQLKAHTRIVISLRQPADRAFSNYLHHIRDGLEELPFEAALEAEEDRARQGWWWGFRYRDVSRYAEQVRAWQEAFGPERVHVLLFEDFKRDPVGVVQEVYRFLGVAGSFVPDTSLRHQATGVPRSRTLHRLLTTPSRLRRALKPLLPAAYRQKLRVALQARNLARVGFPPQTRARLTDAFEDDIGRLESLLDRDLSLWRDAPPA